MKHTSSFIKKMIILPIMLLLVLGMNFTILGDIFDKNVALAYTGTSLGLTDPNFANPTSGSYPRKPNGFSETSDQTKLDIKAGVIDVSKTAFQNYKSKYGLATNPGASSTADSHILMINSAEAYNSYGYVSNDITLTAKGYYSISVDVYSTSSAASLYLTSDNADFAKLELENITTDSWTTCRFYVSNDLDIDVVTKLKLYVGNDDGATSQGIAFFDNILAYKISGAQFFDEVSSLSANSYTRVSGLNNTLSRYEDFVSGTSSIFSTDSDNSGALGDTTKVNTGIYNVAGNNITLANGETIVSPGTDLIKDNNYNLGIVHSAKTYTSYTTQDTIQAGFTYRYTIMAKATDINDGSAWFKVSTINADTTKVIDKTITFANTERAQTNDYQPISIYVVGDPTQDIDINISFGLGTDKENANGQLFVSSYTASVVGYDDYSAVSTNSYIEKFDLSSKYDTSTEYSFSNGNFTLFENNNTDLTKSFIGSLPTGWKSSLEDDATNQKYGIISTNSADITLNQVAFPNIAHVGNVPQETTPNYAVALNNELNDVQSIVSSKKELSPNTTYTFMVYVQTQLYAGSANGAYINIETTDNTPLVLANIDNINTNGVWQCYVISLTTDLNTYEVVMRLGLGNQNDTSRTASGYAIFDSVKIDYPSFAGLNANIHEFDLSNDTFTYAQAKNSNNYYTPLLYTGNYLSGSRTVDGGIINSSNPILPDNLHTDKSNGNVLAITSASETQYNYTSKIEYSFASGYYKVVVPVYTNVYSDIEGADEFGATVRMTNFNKQFDSINTEGEWQDFIFYINCEEDTTTHFVFGLGKADNETAGQVFFGSPVIEKLADEDAFTTSLNADTNESSNNVLEIAPENDDNSSNNTNDNKRDLGTILMTVSTLITGLAVIIAVLGIVIRKINFHKFKKVRVKSGDYDRNTSILARTYQREAMELRDNELKALNAERDMVIAEKERIETEYKAKLTESRSLKMQGASADKKEIASVNATLKSYNHQLGGIAKQLSRLDMKISLVSSEQYLYDITQTLVAKNKERLAEETEKANQENND
ncbi:MAG: hypothetical protein ACLRFG_01920 [Clostridia bacterium]